MKLSRLIPLVGLVFPFLHSLSANPPALLFLDDYYQIPREEQSFSQGIALDESLRGQSNFYSQAANAIPNGTFVLGEALQPFYGVKTVSVPISSDLLRRGDAYVLCCPIKEASGGRKNLGEEEADLLQDYVQEGGILVLILNSIPDPEKSGFDFVGMNRIAGRFGLNFEARQTDTLLVPVSPENPYFRDTKNLIYGNGTTIGIMPEARSHTDVVLEDPQGRPICTVTRYGKGKILLFGDAGSFGNAHLLRPDVDGYQGVRSLFFSLLPDGPFPGFRWENARRLTLSISDEQIVSGYPEENELLSQPKSSGTEEITNGPRELDLLSGAANPDSEAHKKRFSSFIRKRNWEGVIEIPNSGSRVFRFTVDENSASPIEGTLTPAGQVIDLKPSLDPRLNSWLWLFKVGMFCGDVRSYARPGDSWESQALVPLPSLGLESVTVLKQNKVRFQLSEVDAGQLRITQRGMMDLSREGFESLFPRESRYRSSELDLVAGSVQFRADYWIDGKTHLPQRSELIISSAIWSSDRDYPNTYTGSHDWRNFESWEKVNFVATLGRKIVIDFSAE